MPYARARNAISLGRWLLIRSGAAAWPVDPYDDGFWDFHAGGDWAGLADLLVDALHPHSLVDVGCGQGALLGAIRERCPGIRTLGLDASPHAVARARERGLEVTLTDLTAVGREADRRRAAIVEPFDVVVCLETAEHLPPWSSNSLVRMLTAGHRVVFSAAQPNQGGTLHVNEQPLSYWRARFQRQGFDLDPQDEVFRARVGALDLPSWYGSNIHLFSPSAGREAHCVPRACSREPARISSAPPRG
ncbi:MAG TPA: class I SAM-dependent methyltransferase [Vicinamibacterales bacterium]|nr:class I SAM-dependent methyltransferase [Vicinamibacterales bacterium]